MPITIQEIIASDTISQLVDKTNFNFDQILLNGGGPAGPKGGPGPTGPAGGRGPKGTTWYEDNSSVSPGASPNDVPPTPNPLEGDYYLQFNGQVWEYNGNTWVLTNVDLQGPAGTPGSGGGFGLFTGAPIFNQQNIRYNGPVGLNNGATLSNEGVPSVMIGGVTSQTQALTGIPFTSSYIVPEDIVVGNGSDRTSLLIHQKDSNSRGIVFHGGKTPGLNDQFEQVNPALLTNISIAKDDRLVFNIPKAATTPASQTDMLGLQVVAPNRAVDVFAGSSIALQAGSGLSGQFGDGSLLMKVGVAGSAPGNMVEITTAGTQGQTLAQYGFGTNGGGGKFSWLAPSTAPVSYTGTQQWVASNQRMITPIGADNNIELLSGGNIKIYATDGVGAGQAGVSIEAAQNGVGILTNPGPITIRQSSPTSASDIIIENLSTTVAGGGELYIKSGSQTVIRGLNSLPSLDPLLPFSQRGPSIVLDYLAANGMHTRFVGRQTWTRQGGPSVTAPPANIVIYEDLQGLTSNYIYRQTGSLGYVGMTPGSKMHSWQSGVQTATQQPGGAAVVYLGDETSHQPDNAGPTLSPERQAYDASLGFGIFNQDGAGGLGNQRFFSVNSNKMAIALPTILNRSNTNDSNKRMQNNKPTMDFMAPATGGANVYAAPPVYGWFTNSGSTGSANMPTTADLAQSPPLVQLRFMPWNNANSNQGIIGGDGNVRGAGINTYDSFFEFPLGAYPGQRIVLTLDHAAAKYTMGVPGGGLTSFEFYGRIEVRIPMTRVRSLAGGGSFSNWYGTYNVAGNPYPGYHTVYSETDDQDAQYGRVRTQVIDMIWDGGYQQMFNNSAIYPVPFPTPPNGGNVMWQNGWRIISIENTKTGDRIYGQDAFVGGFGT